MPADIFQREDLPFPSSLPEFQRLFPNDAACAACLEAIRWRHGFTCMWCGERGEPFRISTRPHVLRCRKCRKDNSLIVGTVMERTHTPLSVWFWGVYLASSMTPGLSAVQFQRQLGIGRYETAFQILHKLRAGMVRPDRDQWQTFKKALGMTKPGPKPQPIDIRFRRWINLDGPLPAHRPELGPCWLWTGAIRKDGYGAFQIQAKAEMAHRVAFYIAEGRWPDPCALHHCDTPLCVRRTHLFEGTKADNTADMVGKRRSTPRILTDEKVAEMVERKARGETQTAIAEALGVSQALVSLTLKRRIAA
jgi:hypothetical protein